MEFILEKDKDTKNTTRYADTKGHNIYISNEEVKALGSPKVIKVSIEKME